MFPGSLVLDLDPFRSSLRLFLVAGGLFFIPALARAESSPPFFTVEIELAERAPGGAPDQLKAGVTLSDENACSSVDIKRGAVDYQLRVCGKGGSPNAPIFNFDIARTDQTGAGLRQQWKTSSRIPIGQKATIAELFLGDGSSARITAAIR